VRGLELGLQVRNLRLQKKHATLPQDGVAQLEALRFVWDMPEWGWQCVRQALLVHKEVHGDMEVLRPFVVPSEAPWSEEAWGVKLGHRVNDIRHHGNHVKHHPERRAELDALGFVWDDLERRWEEVYAALLAYQEVHGDLKVPQAFVVPSEEAPWPEEAWGMNLGVRVNKIRSQEHYVKDRPERRAELDALGFRWNSLAC
jgi:hypothetical protein